MVRTTKDLVVDIPEHLPIDLPIAAPLPAPFLRHLSEAQPRLFASRFERYRFATQRLSIAGYMTPFVMAERLVRSGRPGVVHDESVSISTGWLLSALQANSPHKRRIPLPTLSTWAKRGLLRYRQWGQPDPQNAAALLLMRQLHPAARGWLPSSMAPDEPLWWCFRQDAPDAPVVACPYPLPDNLPTAVLLWTPWVGAAWDQHFIAIEGLGAIRWGGVKQGGAGRWLLSLDDLYRWEPAVAALWIPALTQGFRSQRANEAFVQSLATSALFRLASTRLVPSDSFVPGMVQGNK